MSVDTTLKALFDIFRDEAKKNPEFRIRLEKLFDEAGPRRRLALSTPADARLAVAPTDGTAPQKRGNRRAVSLVDPIAESDHGEAHLREKLAPLSLEQLRDVLADFRMDASKLAMKWKDRERVINHIVETALSRREKGDAFRA
jgi:hypothetical protein